MKRNMKDVRIIKAGATALLEYQSIVFL